jgi:hypothetical protein
MAKKKDLSPTQKVEIAVGITAAAVAAAGTYFLYGSKQAEKNHTKVKSWMLKAKAEALDALESAKEMSKDEYEELIEGIAGTYASVKDATKGDLSSFKNEMKEYWEHIEEKGKKIVKKAPAKKAAKKTAKKSATKKAAKKSVKKAAKKTAKKAVKKSTKKSSA